MNRKLNIDKITIVNGYIAFDIGKWNMDYTKTLLFSFNNFTINVQNVTGYNIHIYPDNPSLLNEIYELTYKENGTFILSSKKIELIRYTGTIFDNSNFDRNNINRGKIFLYGKNIIY